MTRPTRLPSLDGIRACCITLVVASHASAGLGFPTAWKEPIGSAADGILGVSIFFVLSGFLITLLLLDEETDTGRISLTSFYARRAIRIVPVYLAYVVALVALTKLTTLRIGTCEYVTTLTYTKDFGCGEWVDQHLWSLSVEEQFYALWPAALALFAPRRRRTILIVVILAAPIFRTGMWVVNQHSGYGLWFYRLYLFAFTSNMDALAIGCAGALYVRQSAVQARDLLATRPVAGRAAAVLAMFLVVALRRHLLLGAVTVPLGTTIQALAALYLIASYSHIAQGIGYRVLNLLPVRYIGVLSYSIYIWQQPFFAPEHLYGDSTPALTVFPYNVLACLAVAAASYHALEMPLLAWRKRLRQGDGGHAVRVAGPMSAELADPSGVASAGV